VYRSSDRGATWQAVGAPLDERGTSIRAVATDGDGREIVLTTHRGIYRSANGGRAWELVVDNLPGHIEAGPLVPDPLDPRTLHAGFSLTPYDELRRMAASGETLLARLDAVSIAGGLAFLIVIGLGGVAAIRSLTRPRTRRAAGPRLEDRAR
jgi:hypothetical protein